jgi:hypothetical protein
MAFFRKSAEPPPARLPVLYEPPPQSLPASKTPPDERALRARIWQGGFIGPDLARSCGLSLSALVEFAHGVTSISTTQAAAIAKFIGLGDGSVSGLTVIRDAMERRMRNGRPDWGLTQSTRNRIRSGGRTVDPKDELDVPGPEIEDDSLSLRHTAAVQAFLAGDDQALTLDEINEFVRSQWGPDSWYDPAEDVLRKTDSATPILSRPPPCPIKPIEEIVGPNAVRNKDGVTWGPRLYPRDPALPPPGPARLAPSPGFA